MKVNPRWLPHKGWARPAVPVPLRAWLFEEHSLTQSLAQLCSEGVRVRLLGQRWEYPLVDEARALAMGDGERALVRRVLLCCGKRAVIFARSVIPECSLRGSGRRLGHLGTRSLGSLLFSDPSYHRSEIQYARLRNTHRLFGQATQHLRNGVPGLLWGRRSVFHRRQQPLLVHEVFLPELDVIADRQGG